MADNINKSSTVISFTGPGLEAGTMDARVFALSVLAFTDLCQQAHSILTGEENQLSVRVSADFKTGSFEILFQIIDLIDIPRKVFIGVAELLRIIFAEGGTFDWIKTTKGSKITRPEVTGKNTSFEIDGGINLEVSNNQFKLLCNGSIRMKACTFVKSLKTEGITSIQLKDSPEGKIIQQIKEDEVAFFDFPDYYTELEVSIVTVHLAGKSKWRFSTDTGERFTAHMEDQDFINRIASGNIRFGKGDSLRVRRKTEQSVIGGKVKSEYSIIKVLNIISVQQTDLGADSSDDEIN